MLFGDVVSAGMLTTQIVKLVLLNLILTEGDFWDVFLVASRRRSLTTEIKRGI